MQILAYWHLRSQGIIRYVYGKPGVSALSIIIATAFANQYVFASKEAYISLGNHKEYIILYFSSRGGDSRWYPGACREVQYSAVGLQDYKVIGAAASLRILVP